MAPCIGKTFEEGGAGIGGVAGQSPAGSVGGGEKDIAPGFGDTFHAIATAWQVQETAGPCGVPAEGHGVEIDGGRGGVGSDAEREGFEGGGAALEVGREERALFHLFPFPSAGGIGGDGRFGFLGEGNRGRNHGAQKARERDG